MEYVKRYFTNKPAAEKYAQVYGGFITETPKNDPDANFRELPYLVTVALPVRPM